MSQGTRSKTASHFKSGIDSSNEDDHEDVKASTSHIIQSKSISKDNRGSFQSNPSPLSMGDSFIIKHNFGPLYPIPQSTKSPQISAYQTSLQQFSNRICHNATALAHWYEDLMTQALLINMHEYISGQVIFQLHPACDAMYYIRNSSTAVPFQMRQVEENTSVFWNIHHHHIWRNLLSMTSILPTHLPCM
jgi:hypothetical protein